MNEFPTIRFVIQSKWSVMANASEIRWTTIVWNNDFYMKRIFFVQILHETNISKNFIQNRSINHSIDLNRMKKNL